MSATISRRRLAIEALVTRLGFIQRAKDYSTDAGLAIYVGETPKLGPNDPVDALGVFVRDDLPGDGNDAITRGATCRYRLPVEIHGITKPLDGISPGIAYEGLITDIKEAVEIEGREPGSPSASVDRSLGQPGTTLPTGLSRGQTRVQYREGGSEILGVVLEYFIEFEEPWGQP